MPMKNPYLGSIQTPAAGGSPFSGMPKPAAPAAASAGASAGPSPAGPSPMAAQPPMASPMMKPPTMPGGTPNPSRPPIYVPPTAQSIAPEQISAAPSRDGGPIMEPIDPIDSWGGGGLPNLGPGKGLVGAQPGDPYSLYPARDGGPVTEPIDPIDSWTGGGLPDLGPGKGAAGSYVPPGPVQGDESSLYPPTPPTGEELGGDIDTSIDEMLTNGSTPFGGQIAATLADLIARGGRIPQTERQLLGARENSARQMQGLMADARGELASRGLASIPGVDQGAETLALGNITEKVGRDQAAALSDITTHAMEMSNDDVMSALELATGMSRDQSSAILGAIGQGTQRQTALANIALDQLQQDQDWSKFLAQHGLDVEQVRAQIDQGEVQNVIALLQLYLQGAEIAAGGYY